MFGIRTKSPSLAQEIPVNSKKARPKKTAPKKASLKKGATGRSLIGFAAPKIDQVRIAFIGVGGRMRGHVHQSTFIEGVKIFAVADLHREIAEKAVKVVTDRGLPAPDVYADKKDAYQKILQRSDVDAVFIGTHWDLHAPIAIQAMHAGKHVFLEVPAATSVEDCWALVETAEKTKRHCVMLENVNYGREELMVLNMCRLGVFGELVHGEAAYVHDLRQQMDNIESGIGSWRTYEYTKHNGNLYPTHGLGPIAKYMDINRGDRFDYLSSMSSPALAREIYAREHFPAGDKRRKLKFICGDINTSIIKTALGRTIMLQWDEQLPRPYTRHNLIQGTKGIWAGFPNRVVIEGKTKSTHEWTEGAALDAIFAEYEHPLWKKIGDEAQRMGGHGGIDFVMLWRIVYCLRHGLPMDMDVYDAASWSVIGPLTEWSVKNRSKPIDVPDFTRGKWKTSKPDGFDVD